jgi:hypothetical protein
MSTTVFLGGTTGNDFRESITYALVTRGVPKEQIFNPEVELWDEAAQKLEDKMKADPAVLMIYYLTGDKDGVFFSFNSLHQAEMGLYDEPERTVVIVGCDDYLPGAAKTVPKVYNDLKKRFPEAPIFQSLKEAVVWLIDRLKN